MSRPEESSLPLHALSIEELSLQVRLGCTAEERAVPQEARISVEFRFAEAPPGAARDDLAGTLCYAKACDLLRELCEGREFHLIEKIAVDAYARLREWAGPGVQVALSVHKVRPPVEGLLGGSRYRIGDFRG